MNVGDIFKQTGIIKVSPDDLLVTALAKLSSTHDTAFVFDKKDSFLGIVSPHLSILKKIYPQNTKVEHVMVHPPKVAPSQSIEEVAYIMNKAKMHFLPVIDRGVFLGVISARRILQHCITLEVFQKPISAIIGSRQRLITVTEDESIAKAIQLIKKYKVSKLVVIGLDLKLKGIISEYDMSSYLHSPQKRQSSEILGGSKKAHLVKNVRNLYVTRVITVKQNETYQNVLRRIIESQKGNVIVVDNQMHPIEIITIGDLLKKIEPKKETIDFNVTFLHVKQEDEKKVQSLIDHITRRFNHVSDIKQVLLTVVESKSGGVIEMKLRVLYDIKQESVIQKEGNSLTDVMREMKSAVDTLSSRD